FETGEIIFQTVDPFGIPEFPEELNVSLIGWSGLDQTEGCDKFLVQGLDFCCQTVGFNKIVPCSRAAFINIPFLVTGMILKQDLLDSFVNKGCRFGGKDIPNRHEECQ